MNLKNDIYRKCFHLLLLTFPIAYHFLGKSKSLILFAPIALLVVSTDFARRKSPKLNQIFNKIFAPILKDHEKAGDKFCGASFVLAAACLNFLLFKELIAVTAFVILAISDSAASIIGKAVPSQPFFEKSRAGSAAFFFSALLVLFSCGLFFNAKLWFYLFGFFAVFCVTMFEARPSFLEVDDNFSIPIGFSVIVTFFDLVWNYSY